MPAHRILTDLKIATTNGGTVELGDGTTLSGGTTTGLVVGSTSQKVGFYGTTPVVKGAALTAQLTTLTPADAAGTPDYATAAITNSSPFGFASAQEAITVLYVIQNLQTRLAEVEARLEAVGLVTAN